MSVFAALFYLVLVALALWGAWLGWTRSKSTTARVFTVITALAWAWFTAANAVSAYQFFSEGSFKVYPSGSKMAEVTVSGGEPVTGSSSQCTICYEGPAGKVYVVAAAAIRNGEYRIVAGEPYSVRFEQGRVELDGRTLEPGCHTGVAQQPVEITVREARKFRIEVGAAASCD